MADKNYKVKYSISSTQKNYTYIKSENNKKDEEQNNQQIL